MGSSEFVTQAIDRIPLSGDGRWIDVKHELSAGEYQEYLGRIASDSELGESPLMETGKVMIELVLAHVVAWSFSINGHTEPVTEDSVKNLRNSTFMEIVLAVKAHAATVDAEVAELKKTGGGGPVSSVTSTSVA